MNLNNFIYDTEIKNFHDTIKKLANEFVDHESQKRVSIPVADVFETANDFKLFLELPGIKKEEIKIKFENGKLSISGEKKFYNEETMKLRLSERSFGNFERTFKLGEMVDINKIEAKLADGILQITLFKNQPQKFEKNIEIK